MHHQGPSTGLRRQSWGQMLTSRLSTASQWPSGQVLILGEQVEKFLVIPVVEHTAGCHPTWADPTMVRLHHGPILHLQGQGDEGTSGATPHTPQKAVRCMMRQGVPKGEVLGSPGLQIAFLEGDHLKERTCQSYTANGSLQNGRCTQQ